MVVTPIPPSRSGTDGPALAGPLTASACAEAVKGGRGFEQGRRDGSDALGRRGTRVFPFRGDAGEGTGTTQRGIF